MIISPYFPAIITGVFTLLAGPVFSYLMARSTSKREGATVRAAILAEIDALSAVIEGRAYRTILEEGTRGEIKQLTVRVPDHYSAVFRANLGKIGLLEPETARSVVMFYQLLDAVVQDVQPGGPLNAAPATAESFQETLSILDEAISVAATLKE